MDLIALFITAFLVGLSGAMMPGPLLTVTIAESARRGFKAGPLIVLGHAILELALIIALLAGLSFYLKKPLVTTVISIVGGAFLLFMGLNMIKDVLQGRITLEGSENNAAKGVNMHPVMAGILVSVSNPFWIVWWATIILCGLFLIGLGGYFIYTGIN